MIHETAVVETDHVGMFTRIWHWTHVRELASIGENCTIGQCCYIDRGVRIGDSCKIQNGANVYSPCVIGDNVFIGPGVVISNDRSPKALVWHPELAPRVTIHSGVSIGANSVIMTGVDIGRDSVVGAGAVVLKDVPAGVTVAGVPAKEVVR